MSNRLKISLITALCLLSFFAGGFFQNEEKPNPITKEMVAAAGKLIGLEFTDVERDSMLDGLKEQLDDYESIRKIPLDNSVPPAILFNPIPAGMKFDSTRNPFKMNPAKNAILPKNPEDLAFYSVRQLAELIRTRKITSEQLTRLYLDRLKKYGPKLECVITLTEDLALRQAKRADEEIAAGKYRGPLQGIPYGAKDLLAVKGYKTTWGAAPYKEQVIDEDATVIKRLEEAGAVLVAKLTMGALAWGEVWYGGTTRNPWNLEQGSSGSSAGSCHRHGNLGVDCFALYPLRNHRAAPDIRAGEPHRGDGAKLVDG